MRPVRREEQMRKEPALALRDLGRILDLHGVPGGTPWSILTLLGVPAKKNHATLRIKKSCYEASYIKDTGVPEKIMLH